MEEMINSKLMEEEDWLQFVSRLKSLLSGINSREEREEVLGDLPDPIIQKLANEPYFLLREKQMVPFVEDFGTYLLLAGRGFGKNFTGAHWINRLANERPGSRMAIVAESAADVRDYCVEGPSGVLNVGLPEERPTYQPSKRRLTWENGSQATTYSAAKPSQLRGFSGEVVWWDEAAKSRYADEVYEQIEYTLREGEDPKLLVTTTPRPIPTIKNMLEDDEVRAVRGSSLENRSNLADRFVEKLEKKKNTRLGRQEVEAQILDEAPDSLWSHSDIKHITPDELEELEEDFQKIVVAVDPSASKGGDEAGIIVAGKIGKKAYVLEDFSGQMSPRQWAKRATQAYSASPDDYKWPPADIIVAEKNQGGDMVRSTIKTQLPHAAYKGIHAKRGKKLRAQPVASSYDKVRHVGTLPDLEDQMATWQPSDDESPDRLDALVYAITELFSLDEDNTEERRKEAFSKILGI